MGIRCISVAVFFSLFAVGSHSAVRDTMSVRERMAERDSYTDIMFGCVTSGTPISYIDRYEGPLTLLSAAFENAHSTACPTFSPEDARTIGAGSAKTYIRMRESRIWGTLDYNDGRYADAGSSLTADAALVWPYVVVDSTIKRVHNSCLKVGAGFARDLDNWSLGVDLFCAATHESRKSEVGPSNFSCDMKATLGLAYIFPEYRLGVSVGGRKYSQDNGLSTAKGTIPTTYHLLGLWSDMPSLRGESDGITYAGKGFSAGIHLTPRRNADLYASAVFSKLNLDKDIELNSQGITFSSQTVKELSFEVGKVLNNCRLLKKIELEFGIIQRRGAACRTDSQDVIHSEAAADGDYDSDCPHLWVTMAAAKGNESFMNDFALRIGFAKWRERTTEPRQRMENEAFRMNIRWAGRWFSGRFSFRPEVILATDFALDQKADGLRITSDGHFQPVKAQYDFLTNNRGTAEVSLRAGIDVSEGLCFAVTPKCGLSYFADGEKSSFVRIGLSAIF